MGTIVEITVADKEKPRRIVNETISKAFAEMTRVEELLSKFNPDSDISKINAWAQKYPVKVNPETIYLLGQAKRFSQLTDGAFDITVEPLLELWGYCARDKGRIPPKKQIEETLNITGYKKIAISQEDNTVLLPHQDMSIALGGIAKGYAVDKAIEILKGEGIKNALVNAGGDIYALGKRSKTRKWRVAVQHPRKADAILTVLEVEDEAIATSGDYQRFFEVNGNRYSHIIDPKTGYPCENVPASVTILAKDCLSADTLATSIFVLGPQKGLNLVEELNNTEALIVSAEKQELDILLSKGLEGRLSIQR
ncbi:MAG: FAD:protein FMN transferase [Candidatus Omnitrophica bacterium]|nr:FAD:protein FMN transferase [Candidatus Omnitrophota bacterium]